MRTLVRICAEQWHAVERDLLSLQWSWDRTDKRFRHIITGAVMSLWTLASVVVASPPGTAVYHAETRNGQQTLEAQMLAELGGQRASSSPYPLKPQQQKKVDSFAELPDYGGFKLTALPVEDFKATREAMAVEARERAMAGKGGDRVVKDKYDPFGKQGRAS
jgi:hypothetical protein